MHVAVLGAGYAGLTLVRRLERSLPADVALTLVDEREFHLVQHLLHRVIREPGLADGISVPLEECCRRADVRRGRVEEVDPDTGTVELADGTLEYDVGAVCLGAQTAYYGLPGVDSHGLPLKRLEHALRIREGFLALQDDDRAVVVGAGLSGVQVAGELAALADADGAETEVLLVERESTVAPGFPAPFRHAVADELGDRGVTVRTDTRVESAEAGRLVVSNGADVPYGQFVWTGGIAGTGALSGSRPRVRSTLRLGTRTFGLGDAVRVVDDGGQAVPASAQTAVRQARVAAKNVERLVEHERDGSGFEPRFARYEYDSLGWVVTVGDGTVAQVGSRVLRGPPALALKTTIGAQHLAGVGAVAEAVELVNESFTK